MIVQPPNGNLLDAVMSRAQLDLDEHDLGRMVNLLNLTWQCYENEGVHRARTVATALLYQAAQIRRRDYDSKLADYVSRCAESCLLAWADEVAVQEAVTQLAELDVTTTRD